MFLSGEGEAFGVFFDLQDEKSISSFKGPQLKQRVKDFPLCTVVYNALASSDAGLSDRYAHRNITLFLLRKGNNDMPIVKKYPHGLAVYPKSFKTFTVTPGKICLQFNHPEIKTRIVRGEEQDLIRVEGVRCLPVPGGDIQIEFIAVGLKLDIIKETQLQMLEAYLQVDEPGFIEFLELLRSRLDDIIRSTRIKRA